MIPVSIRRETPADVAAIRHLTDLAFTGLKYSNGYEGAIVDGLRSAGALTLSLVAIPSPSTPDSADTGAQTAEGDQRILGHVAFSRVTINGKASEYYGLGPISVHSSSQHQGIGSALIREGVERIRRLGAKGVVLLGDPGYYTRFGFKPTDRLWYAGAPKEFFFVLQLDETDTLSGEIEYHEAFSP